MKKKYTNLAGKKSKINHHDVIDYLGKERTEIIEEKQKGVFYEFLC